MRNYKRLRKRRDFAVPLLETLSELPGHEATASEVIGEVIRRYRDFIEPTGFERTRDGDLRCAYELRWTRQELTELGLMESPRHGVWRITAEGLKWLRDNPDATHVEPSYGPWSQDEIVSDGGTGNAALKEGEHLGLSNEGSTGPYWLYTQENYAVALLKLLAELPGHQGRPTAVIAEFLRRFRHFIPPEGFELLAKSKRERWVSHVYWARYSLTRAALMDWPTPGVWRVSQKGLEWLRENPSPTSLGLGSLLTTRSLRQRTTATVRRRSRRASQTRSDEESRWLEIIEGEVRAARDFLQGRAPRPSDERLCDLVWLCYLLELHQEVHDLFAIIDRSAVDPWLYRRTARLAKLSAMKVNQ